MAGTDRCRDPRAGSRGRPPCLPPRAIGDGPPAAGGIAVMLAELLATPPSGNLQSTASVEEVVSASGVRAFLMREPAFPFLSLSLHLRGGGATDPAGKEGLAFMASGLLDEGAGPYDSQ